MHTWWGLEFQPENKLKGCLQSGQGARFPLSVCGGVAVVVVGGGGGRQCFVSASK